MKISNNFIKRFGILDCYFQSLHDPALVFESGIPVNFFSARCVYCVIIHQVNFASLRSAYDSTVECMEYPQIKTIAIIAEGIPENLTRKLIKLADTKEVTIIGPATVGGVKPGCFKIGNTGGMMDNILHSKLYRPGSVAYVSR